METDFKFGHPAGKPVIYGKHFPVPELKLRFVNDKNDAMASDEVIVRYKWKWFEYPYQEHPTGVWSTAYYHSKCSTDVDGRVTVPEYDLIPAGWYKGAFLFGGGVSQNSRI
ncbi:MAG: hypothetical protein QM785_16020 [Pyrinomonadaceae bacterium]